LLGGEIRKYFSSKPITHFCKFNCAIFVFVWNYFNNFAPKNKYKNTYLAQKNRKNNRFYHLQIVILL